MGNGHTTISVSPETLDEINDAMPDEYDSKDAFLLDLVRDGEVVVEATGVAESQFTELCDRLERVEASASTAESRAGSIENTLEEMGR
jgi:hypothetical protein